jgi:hypothetical protein
MYKKMDIGTTIRVATSGIHWKESQGIGIQNWSCIEEIYTREI